MKELKRDNIDIKELPILERFMRKLVILTIVTVFALGFGFNEVAHGTAADPSDPTLDGTPDLAPPTIDLGDYNGILGGKFPPPGNAINGDNASGGTFRFLDDGFGIFDSFNLGWAKDDFFPDQQGLAFTLRNGGIVVWDNNGIEDDSYLTINFGGSFYEEAFNGQLGVGRNHAFGMSNFFDFIYASRVEFLVPMTIDEIIAYFDGDGPTSFPFDPDHPLLQYRMNIWSASVADPLLPTYTGKFVGDVLSTDSTLGTFTWSDTGVKRDFPSTTTGLIDDPIFRLTWIPDTPIILSAGVYYFSHDVAIQLDDDGDGVPNVADRCPDSMLDGISLNPNQYGQNSIIDGQFDFYSTFGPFEVGPNDDQSVVYDIVDTEGCTCAQIIEALGIGKGHSKKGCSPGIMQEFTGINANPDRKEGIGRK